MGFEVNDEILEYGLPLNTPYSIKPLSTGDYFEYVTYNRHMKLSTYLKQKAPSELDGRSKVRKFIKEHSDNPEQVIRDLEDLLIIQFDIMHEEYTSNLKKEIKEQREAIDSALEQYRHINAPLIWIGSHLDWIVAGERVNTLLTFLCFVSQVVLHHPISVIGMGVGSSGKSYIMNNALNMIPSKFIVREKKPTLSSMFRRSQEDEWYYHDKIVYYGDMGGESDQTDTEDTLNLLKELQTDGELNRPVSAKKDGNDFEVVDLMLKGTPALAYTTTPDAGNNKRNSDDALFDSQVLSRSILYQPRIDNKQIFDSMCTYLEFGGKTARQQEKIKNNLFSIMPNVVLGLREIFDGVKVEDEDKYEHTLDFKPRINVINPFHRLIIKFIGNSEFYKRDSAKYEAILKAIAVCNYYNHDILEMDGQKVMFVNFDDVAFFLSLMKSYSVSANLSITPTEADILYDILKQYELYETKGVKGFLRPPIIRSSDSAGFWDDDEQEELSDEIGVTINDYQKFSKGKYSDSTIRRAFKSFKNKGLCYIVESDQSRSALYKFTESDEVNINDFTEELQITNEDVKFFEEEYPVNICNYLMNDYLTPNISVYNQYDGVPVPKWNEEKI